MLKKIALINNLLIKIIEKSRELDSNIFALW